MQAPWLYLITVLYNMLAHKKFKAFTCSISNSRIFILIQDNYCHKTNITNWFMKTLTTFFICSNSIFRLFTNIHAEHNNLRSQRRHSVVEAVTIHSIGMSCKCVPAIRLALTSIYIFAIWTRNLNTAQHFPVLH